MKIAAWIVGIIISFFVGLFALQYAASERVEVVELHTVDQVGEPQVTRLWIVDHEGTPYLRVGADGSGWYSRLVDNETVGMRRGGQMGRYTAEPRPALTDPINALMQEKYTWGDSLIGNLVGSREGSIPIALVPVGN